MSIHKRGLLAGSGLFVAATAALAQAPQTTSSPSGSISLEEVIVTARRRAESLQDVPQTVNVVTADTIEKLNILKLEDVQAVVPGLTLSSGNTGVAATAAVRGVSFTSQTQTAPTVEFYWDDAPIESNFLFQSLFDVGQIEVLRGPQGTLRGRSSPSGSITVTARRPDLVEFGGYGMVTGTDQNGYNAQGAVNVPIAADVLAVRVAAAYDENEYDQVKSIFDNTDPQSKTKAGRIGIAFRPNDSLDAYLGYQYLKRDLTSFSHVAGPGFVGTLPGGFLPRNNPPLAPSDRRSVQDLPNLVDQEFNILTANVDWRFAGQRLSYVGGYRDLEIPADLTQDAGNLYPGYEPINHQVPKQTQRTHELRLASEERIANLFDYTVGVFYSKIDTSADVNQVGGVLPPGIPATNLLISRQQFIEEKSAFASLTWHLTDRTELTTGGRYIRHEISEPTAIFLQTLMPLPIGPGGSILPPGTYPQAVPTIASEDEPFIYNVALSHHFTDQFMAYANAGSAWRRGTTPLGVRHSPNGTILDDLLTIEPEKSRSYEIGFKSTFWENRARVNLAVYHQDYDGLIFRATNPITYFSNQVGTLQEFNFITSADSTVRGIELDTTLQFTPNWYASLAVSYADGRVDDQLIPCNDPSVTLTPSMPVALCVSDDPVSTAPKWSGTLQSEYSMQVSAAMDGYVRGLYTYALRNDDQQPGFNGFQVPSHGLLSLYLGVRDPNDAWEVSIFAKNLFDKETTLVWENGLSNNQVSPNPTVNYYLTTVTPPREIGITARFSFGSR